MDKEKKEKIKQILLATGLSVSALIAGAHLLKSKPIKPIIHKKRKADNKMENTRRKNRIVDPAKLKIHSDPRPSSIK